MSDSFLYKWTDAGTGKVYIGSHKGSPDDGYICSSEYMLAEYCVRPDDFSREIIKFGVWTSIRIEEDAMIRAHWTNNIPCYNKATGGTFKIDDDIRAAMSAASKGKPKRDSHRTNIANANKLKANRPDIIAKLRLPKPAGHGDSVSRATSGKKKTPEHCAAMSRARTGVSTGPCSEKRKRAISEANTGRLSGAKGKTYEEIMGPDNARVLRAARAVAMTKIRANQQMKVCPHCNFEGKGPNMNRWHFDRCSKKCS